MKLLSFQHRFLKGLQTAPVACFSAPRGNGKTSLAAMVGARFLDIIPKGQEIAIVAASVDQGRTCFRMARTLLESSRLNTFHFLDSAQRCVATRSDGTKLKVMAASGRGAMGLVKVPLVIADEPAAWRQNDGELLADALLTAIGKPGSPMRLIFAGTLAPLGVPGHWWHSMVKGGTRDGYYVQLHQGDPKRWADLRHVYRVNPLARISPDFRDTLRRERDEALHDSRLRARFLSYRLNVPSRDESEVLLTTADWEQVTSRKAGEAEGRPVVALDLGGGRAWSAAVAWWRSGRVEAFALAPGIPDLDAQEKRDRVPAGTYTRLADAGVLQTDGERRVPRPEALMGHILSWRPEVIICDRFRLPELQDCRVPVPIIPRVTRWSEAAEDIRALRKYALDGPMSVAPRSRALIEASLAVAEVKNDDQGSTRLVKRDPSSNSARDDVAAALTLAAGAVSRWPAPRRPVYLGVA